MFDTISCEADQLTEMYQSRFIHDTIMNSDACTEYGLDFLSIKKKTRRKVLFITNRRKKFILSIFPRVKIAALCNTLAIVHKKIVLNKAKRVYISDDLIINLQTAIPDMNGQTINNDSTVQESNDTSDSTISVDNKSVLNISSFIEPIISQILPTKTILSSDEETDTSKKNLIKESSMVLNENATQPPSSFIELNSTNEIPVPSSTQCWLSHNNYLFVFLSNCINMFSCNHQYNC